MMEAARRQEARQDKERQNKARGEKERQEKQYPLTPDFLKRNDITYYKKCIDENVAGARYKGHSMELKPVNRLPDHVELLRKDLVNFDGKVPKSMKTRMLKTFSADEVRVGGSKPMPLDSVYWGPFSGDADKDEKVKIKHQRDNISAAQTKAKQISGYDRESEAEWVDLLLGFLFKKYENATSAGTESRHHHLIGQWVLAQTLPWTEACNLGSTEDVVQPIPDLCYGFPIYTAEKLKKEGVSKGYLDSDSFANFTFDFLSTLRKKDIITSPARGLARFPSNNTTDDGLRADHLMCFPWAVVEVKRDKGDAKVKCYCQAANAAAAALALQESLSGQIYGAATADIFPVIAFTCIGPKIRTWLAYTKYEEERAIREMVCIFSTDIRTTWGVYSMQLLVKNMHDWIADFVKPKLVSLLRFLRIEGLYCKPSRWQVPQSPTLPRPQRRRSMAVEPRSRNANLSDIRSPKCEQPDDEDSGIGGMWGDDDLQRTASPARDSFEETAIREILDDRKRLRIKNRRTEYYVCYKVADHCYHDWVDVGIVGKNSKLVAEYEKRKELRPRRKSLLRKLTFSA